MEPKTKYLITGIALAGAAVTTGVVLWTLSQGNNTTTTTTNTTSCTEDSQCASGYSCIDGTCIATSPETICEVNGGTVCSSDSGCSSCQTCINGCCGTLVPDSIVQTTDLTSLNQGESVASVGVPFSNIAICKWSDLNFGGGAGTANQWTATGQVIDASGVGIACIPITVASTNSIVSIYDYPSNTDSDGNFSFTFGLTSPQQAGAACPGPGSTSNGIITGSFNVSVTGTSLMIAFPFDITVSILGV